MTPKSWMTVNALLNQYHAGAATEVFRYLPETEAKAAEDNTVTCRGLTDFISSPSTFVQRVHYSWLLHLIKDLDGYMQNLCISALPKQAGKRLRKLCGIKQEALPLPERLKAFVRRQLYRRLVEVPDLVPPAFIAESKMTVLLSLDKEQLLNIIDYLGIYDMVPQLRNNIDQRMVTRAYNALSPQKRDFLDQLLKRKKSAAAARSDLREVAQQPEQLMRWLHKGGVLKLARALHGEHGSLIWHLCHILDTGRAQLIQGYHEQMEEDSDLKDQAVTCLEEVMHYLRYT